MVALAGDAIENSGAPGTPVAGGEPSRHRVRPGETAFSIARSYDIPVSELAEWNGLGPDLAPRLDAMGEAAREELFAIFPELAAGDPGPLARPQVRAREAAVLV